MIATEQDHRLITATSLALEGKIGLDDDTQRLRAQIEEGPSSDKLGTACEVAIAFIRWAQDLKREATSNVKDEPQPPRSGGGR